MNIEKIISPKGLIFFICLTLLIIIAIFFFSKLEEKADNEITKEVLGNFKTALLILLSGSILISTIIGIINLIEFIREINP